jgi:hypothetical protein
MKDMFIDDPFGANRFCAHQVIEQMLELLEVWIPEHKAEIVQRMKKKRSAELIDHVQVGDYDLALWPFQSTRAKRIRQCPVDRNDVQKFSS